MLNWIDYWLNRITMYRLVLYYVVALVVVAIGAAAFGLIPYSPVSILASTGIILTVCWITNAIFSYVFEAPTNVESVYITAFILVLIIAPPLSTSDMRYWMLAGWASVLAMASKYILAIGKKHLFNPAAIAVVLTALVLNQSANWWVGTTVLVPFVLIGGFLMTRKLRRTDLVVSFLIAAFASIEWFAVLRGSDPFGTAQRILLTSPLLFFAFVMLTEPLTTPPTRARRIVYGLLVGGLFAPAIHLWSVYSTPELALVAGNLFAYLASPKEKLMLRLTAREKVGTDTYDFIFKPDRPFHFAPGQYLEWTMLHAKPDSRGNRRYFTIASSPTEPDLRMGVKFYAHASSFKQALATLHRGDTIVASQLSGDFTLPRNQKKKLVFIAGGIGITPFRSMIKYLIDRNERRPITLIYSNQIVEDIAYAKVFDEAQRRLGINTVYTLTRGDRAPASWGGRTGHIDARMIAEAVPDYRDRTFYISGPQSLVTSVSAVIRSMGIPLSHIKKDFFPGFA